MISKHVVKAKETLEVSRVFRIIDNKRDGTLDRDELLEALKDYSTTLKLSEVELVDLFNTLDIKRTGAVEFSEFVT